MLAMSVFLIAGAILFTDQLTKFVVDSFMYLNQSIPVIPSIFHLTYVRNAGAAFGILAYRRGFFIVVTVALLAIIILFLRQLGKDDKILRLALVIQMGGALGNLTDRIRTGYVVDFFDFQFWPVFNVADIAIVAGVVLLLASLLQTPRKRGV